MSHGLILCAPSRLHKTAGGQKNFWNGMLQFFSGRTVQAVEPFVRSGRGGLPAHLPAAGRGVGAGEAHPQRVGRAGPEWAMRRGRARAGGGGFRPPSIFGVSTVFFFGFLSIPGPNVSRLSVCAVTEVHSWGGMKVRPLSDIFSESLGKEIPGGCIFSGAQLHPAGGWVTEETDVPKIRNQITAYAPCRADESY